LGKFVEAQKSWEKLRKDFSDWWVKRFRERGSLSVLGSFLLFFLDHTKGG
jgi:hypothetical protein